MLINFRRKYGGSARDAYKYANHLDEYRRIIDKAAAGMSESSLKEAYTSDPSSLTVPSRVGHVLLSVFPLSDINRKRFCITSPTPHMQLRVLEILDNNRDAACRRLYEICLRAGHNLGCLSLASDLLDRHYHTFLTAGGCWGLCRMGHSNRKPHDDQKLRTWKTQTDEPSKFLIVNKVMKLETHPVNPGANHSGRAKCKAKCASPVEIFTVKKNQSSPLEPGRYYRPDTRTFPTFDSFYVDKRGHAIAFQATTSTKHNVKDEGVEWLKKHGINRITYILVSPKSTIDAGILLPVEITGKNVFDGVYRMELDFNFQRN